MEKFKLNDHVLCDIGINKASEVFKMSVEQLQKLDSELLEEASSQIESARGIDADARLRWVKYPLLAFMHLHGDREWNSMTEFIAALYLYMKRASYALTMSGMQHQVDLTNLKYHEEQEARKENAE